MTTILRSLFKGATLGALAISLAAGPAFAGHGSSGGSFGGFMSKHKSAGSSGGSSGGFMSKHKSAGSSGGSHGGSFGGFMSKHKSAASSGGSSGGSY